jgi:hypothetical protein
MPNPAKQIVLGAALLASTAMVTNADPLSRTDGKSAASGAAVPSGAHRTSGNEFTALPPSDATLTRDSIALPGVSVVAPYNSRPYTTDIGPKASSNGRVKAERYPASPDYVMDIAMHPYTSGVGSKAGPNRTLRVDHYEMPPDYKTNVSKHPYTSGLGPPVESRNRAGDGRVNANGRE